MAIYDNRITKSEHLTIHRLLRHCGLSIRYSSNRLYSLVTVPPELVVPRLLGFHGISFMISPVATAAEADNASRDGGKDEYLFHDKVE